MVRFTKPAHTIKKKVLDMLETESLGERGREKMQIRYSTSRRDSLGFRFGVSLRVMSGPPATLVASGMVRDVNVEGETRDTWCAGKGICRPLPTPRFKVPNQCLELINEDLRFVLSNAEVEKVAEDLGLP